MRIWDKSKPPTGPFTLNRDCEQARGLAAWYPHGSASSAAMVVDYAGSFHLTCVNSPKMTLGACGEPSLSLVSSSSTHAIVSKAAATTVPLTLAGWFSTTNADADQKIISISTADAGVDEFILDVNGGYIRGIAGGSAVSAASKSGVLSNTWQHAVAVYRSNTSRTAYINSSAGNEDTTTVVTNPSVINRTAIGATYHNGTFSWYFDGLIGESAIWTVALSDHVIRRLYDPATRFEMWYPLRSRKWFSAPTANFQISWASQANTIVSQGVTNAP